MNDFQIVTRKFRKKNINYRILRKNGDIDILTQIESSNSIESVLLGTKFRNNFSGPIPGHAVYTKYQKIINSFLTIDLHIGGLTHKCILYFDAGLIFKNTYNNQNKLTLEAEYITLLLHLIIDKQYISQSNKKKLNKIASNIGRKINNKLIIEIIADFYNQGLANKILYLSQNKQWSKLIALRKQLLTISLLKRPFSIILYFQLFASRILKTLNPFAKGPLIALIGTDAAGKSTIAYELSRQFATGSYKTKVVYMGWRESLIPGTNIGMRIDNKISGKLISKTYARKARSIIITIIFMIERYIRYAFNIFPYRQMGYIVITDRFFYDRWVLDEYITARWIKILTWLSPKPSLTVLVDAKPTTLYRRSKEFSINAYAHQRKLFSRASNLLNAIKLKTDRKNVKKSASKIISLVLSKDFL